MSDSEHELVFNLQCLNRRTARKKFRKDILDTWENKCAYCESDRAHTLDHVIPKSKGGPTKRWNLVACCGVCNLSKSDEDHITWFRQQRFWSEDKELKILEWLNKDHDQVEAARIYEELCKIPIMPILPSGTKNETDDGGADLIES